jgi:hypothetical protein
MKKLAFALLLLSAASFASGGQTPSGGGKAPNGNCGLLYGENHSLLFCAPSGWTLDNGIMNDQGIYAAFYPEGSSWQAAKQAGTVMYINVVGKPADATVEKMMADDADEAKQATPSTVTKAGEPIKAAAASAAVLLFAPGAFNRYEAVAYIGEEKVLVMFVISSKDQDTFKKDYPVFVQLVQSYKFLGSAVTVEPK